MTVNEYSKKMKSLIDCQVVFDDVSITILNTQNWRDVTAFATDLEVNGNRILQFDAVGIDSTKLVFPLIVAETGDPENSFVGLKSFSKLIKKLKYVPKYTNNVYAFK
jgi:hypothetical protein